MLTPWATPAGATDEMAAGPRVLGRASLPVGRLENRFAWQRRQGPLPRDVPQKGEGVRVFYAGRKMPGRSPDKRWDGLMRMPVAGPNECRSKGTSRDECRGRCPSPGDEADETPPRLSFLDVSPYSASSSSPTSAATRQPFDTLLSGSVARRISRIGI